MKDYKAFITGSHAYGIPTVESDLDLVIRCNPLTRRLIAKVSESEHAVPLAVRFGRLNLILCCDDRRFQNWRRGTHDLVKLRPVSRNAACLHFQQLRKATGEKMPGSDSKGY